MKLRWRIERKFWSLYHQVRHPVDSWYVHRKWASRPTVGDRVQDCRYQVHTVTEVNGDDLTLDDGSRCSWMHCCDPVE